MNAKLAVFILALLSGGCGWLGPFPVATSTPLPPTAAIPAPVANTAALPESASPGPDSFTPTRLQMVELQIRRRDISDEEVLQAMETVPRHEFVPAEFLSQAYDDHPLPIGFGQTISQPYIVALMTQLLEFSAGDRVLEIGTGSGYQAAVLAELTDEVYTIEIIPQLAERAQATFDRLGYDQVKAKQADGYWGWEEVGPFQAIIVTAAPDHVPQPLLNQLADGGRMVIPIGPPGGYQSLWIVTRRGDEFRQVNWGGVRFVPLTREEER
jgi:protein-L-isoaspartate(D-aspartate) O-methyltransferase